MHISFYLQVQLLYKLDTDGMFEMYSIIPYISRISCIHHIETLGECYGV